MGYLVRDMDLPNVVTHYVEQQGYWVVSGFPSPVIECARDRMFINTGYFGNDGEWVPRDKDFVAWYDSIVRWVHRTHRYRPDNSCWEARPAS